MKMSTFYKKKLKDPQFFEPISINDLTLPISILLGPNGTGKSQSLINMKSELSKNNIKFIEYSTSKDDIVEKTGSPFGDWDPSKLAMAFTSEGERMSASFFDWAETKLVQEVLKDKEPIYILIDEADSGLSPDRIRQSLRQAGSIAVMEHEQGRTIHMIFTCNSYEMYKALKSDFTEYIWVPTKEKVQFNSYEEFEAPYIDYLLNVHNKRDEEGDTNG